MNANRKHVLAGLAATGILAGAVAGGGVALASSRTPAATVATTATTATPPAAGWCDGPGGMHGMGYGRQAVLAAAADYLGVSQTQLVSQLQAGKSLADVATAQHKSVAGLKNAILAAMTSRINASTGLSTAQKAERISEVKSHLDAMVNGTYAVGTGGYRMHSPMRDAGQPAGWMHGM
ncbi:MAG TPA: hypothetical protein VF838_12735 [Trebonia sp.]